MVGRISKLTMVRQSSSMHFLFKQGPVVSPFLKHTTIAQTKSSSVSISLCLPFLCPLFKGVDLFKQGMNCMTTDPNQVAVIDPQYCSSTPVDLVIKKLAWNNYEIKDIKGEAVFKVKSEFPYYQGRKVCSDTARNPIFSMQRKLPSAHARWQVFKGNSKDPRDVLFTAKQPSVVQISTAIDIYLVDNKDESACDYKVKGSLVGRSCTIYKGETNTIIAQMHEKHSVQSLVLGRDTFLVTVYPQVDAAFITAVIIAVDSMLI